MLRIFDGDNINTLTDEIDEYAARWSKKIISVSIATAYRHIGTSSIQKLHYTIAVVFEDK